MEKEKKISSDGLLSVIHMVIKQIESKETSIPKEDKPYLYSVSPIELCRIGECTGIDKKELGMLVNVAFSIIRGCILDYEDLKTLKTDNIGEIILQIEHLRMIMSI